MLVFIPKANDPWAVKAKKKKPEENNIETRIVEIFLDSTSEARSS